MPLYEYRCEKCGHEFEVIRKFSDGPLRKAPDCPKDRKCKLTKLVSASAFQLKGGGWYADGYSAPGKSAGGDKKASDSAKKSDSKKSAKKGD